MTDSYPDEDIDEPTTTSGYRSYEVYQRERVGETTNLVNPRDLISDQYLADPFTVPEVLRENYPCFRDWVGNRFWLTRYDDVTSVFVDDANFETRPVRSAYGSQIDGQDLRDTPEFRRAWVDAHDAALDRSLAGVLDGLHETADLAIGFADGLAAELFQSVLGLGNQAAQARELLRLVKAGTGWDERTRIEGLEAHRQLRAVIADALTDRSDQPRDDVMTTCVERDATADDVVVTLLESDLDTLPASLANLWCLLLANPEQFDAVKAEPRLMKFAYLEALRHSPPQIAADRFARHEVERFGRLLPQGALVHLSAAAANRDPRQFADPASFDVARTDLCRREPRGQYRADGLPAGITFGHGKPSRLPAIPRDAARSGYALTRDIAVAASLALLERFPALSLVDQMPPVPRLDRLGGVYRCRTLPVTLS